MSELFNGKEIPTTQDERFLDYYQKIDNGNIPYFVGIHFAAAQYADLADITLHKIIYYVGKGNLMKAAAFIEFAEKLRTRRQTRYFDTGLRQFKGA